MDIFEKYDPQTWNKETPYPYIAIQTSDPDDFEVVYTGYDIDEFFKVFERRFFLEFLVIMRFSATSYMELGQVKDFQTLKREVSWKIEKKE